MSSESLADAIFDDIEMQPTDLQTIEATSVIIDVESIKASMEKDLEEVAKKHNEKPSIFKIPDGFRTTKKSSRKVHKPCKVAIGPFHCHDSDLQPMQEFKLKFQHQLSLEEGYNHFIDNTMLTEANIRQAKKYYREITMDDSKKKKKQKKKDNSKKKDKEKKHDSKVKEDITMEDGREKEEITLDDDSSFGKMLVVDGAFVVWFLFATSNYYTNNPIKDLPTRDDYPFLLKLNERETKEIKRDLLLLENQLPFFILEQWFTFYSRNNDTIKQNPLYFASIAHDALTCQYPILVSSELKSFENFKRILHLENEIIRHLLHLVMLVCIPKPKTGSNPPNNSKVPLKTITELYQAGIKFEANKDGDLDKKFELKFKSGVLKMPTLSIDEFSEALFRNMLAFEQYYLNTFELTKYLYVMDQLIDTKHDVKILEEHHMIQNWLQSKKKVSKLFNSVTQHTTYIDDPELNVMSDSINRYVNKPWNSWMATLRRDYFSSPWALISLIAALVLLALTIIQTLASGRQINWKF